MSVLRLTPFVVLTSLSSLVTGACVDPDDPAALGESEQEIRGGTQIDTAELKAVVSLANRNGAMLSRFCSGTFIHPQFVLTAAHCLPTCSSTQPLGCVQGGWPAIDGGFWIGLDGPATIEVHDSLDGLGGNTFQADQVFFPRLSDWGGNSPPDVAILHVTSPLRTAVIPVLDGSWLPTPTGIDGQWRNAGIQIAGFSDETFGAWLRRIAAVNVTGSVMNNRWFEAHSNTAQICGGDSGGPALWRTLQGRLAVGGVNGRKSDCFTSNDFRTWESFIPRPLLERVAASPAGHCGGRSWDACVARLSPAQPPVAPSAVTAEADNDGINVRWTNTATPGVFQVRLRRSPAFADGQERFLVADGGRKVFADSFASGTRRDAAYTYILCADNTLDETACGFVVFAAPVAVAPTEVVASAPGTFELRLHFRTVDNGQMQPDVRIYRNGVSGFRTQPLNRTIDFSDTQDVYAYTNYTYKVCTVSKSGVEACATAKTDTYDGLPQCPSGYQYCNGACRRVWQCPHPQ